MTRWTWAIGPYKQRDLATPDVVRTSDLYRTNWIGAAYDLLGTIPSIHDGDDIVRMGANIYGENVYAMSDGIVTFAEDVTGSTWRLLCVIQHTWQGKHVYTRYAHLKDLLVKVGDSVKAGQLIGHVGDAFGALAPHLHLNICTTELLGTSPKYWASTGHTAAEATALIFANFTDPLLWMKARLQEQMTLYNGLFQPNTALITAYALQADGSLAWSGVYKGGSAIVFEAKQDSGVTWQGLEFLKTSDGRYVFEGDVIQGTPYVPVTPAPGVDVVMYAKVDAGTTLNIRAAADISSAIIGTFGSGEIVHVWKDSLKNNFWQLSQQNGFVDADFVSATNPNTPPVQPVTIQVWIAPTATQGVHVRRSALIDPSTIVTDPVTGKDVLLFPIDPSTGKPTVLTVLAKPTNDASGVPWYTIDPSSAPLGGYVIDGQFVVLTAPNP